jgi:inorganic pyrophosphatase
MKAVFCGTLDKVSMVGLIKLWDCKDVDWIVLAQEWVQSRLLLKQ